MMANLYLTGLALIIVGLSSLGNVQSEHELLDGLNWDLWFERLFTDTQYDLGGPVVMQILVRLEKGSSQQIKPVRKSIVDFWFDANIGNHEHCSTEYLAKMESERKKLLSNGFNRQDVYTRTRERVIENCYIRLLNGVGDIATVNADEQRSIFELGSLWNEVQQNRDQAEKHWNLGNHIAKMVGPAAVKVQEDFVNTWRKGPCVRLLTELDDLDKKIESFLATFDYSTRQKRSNAASKWITGIEACRHLQTEAELSNVWQYVQVR